MSVCCRNAELSASASEQISGGNNGVGPLGNLGEPQTGGYFNGNGNNPHVEPDLVQPPGPQGNSGDPGTGGFFNPNNPHFEE